MSWMKSCAGWVRPRSKLRLKRVGIVSEAAGPHHLMGLRQRALIPDRWRVRRTVGPAGGEPVRRRGA